MSNLKKEPKKTLYHIILYLRHTFYLASLVCCKESQKSTKLHIFKFKSFSLDLWTHTGFGLVDSNYVSSYVSVVHAVYVTLIACLPVIWKDPSSVVLSEVSAFSVES